MLIDKAFDIETIPNSSMLDRLPEPELKLGNLTDPRKIEAKKEEAKAEQIEKMALNPLYGRVCSAAFASDSSSLAMVIGEDSDKEETALVEWILFCFSGSRLITWNGNNFDMPFLFKRAMILGIDLAQFNLPMLPAYTKRYGSEHHIDLMQVWCGWNGYARLNEVSRMVLGREKIEVDFREFPEMIKTEAGREKIRNYNMGDARELTWSLFQRFQGVLI